jgi:hypothetical protein
MTANAIAECGRRNPQPQIQNQHLAWPIPSPVALVSGPQHGRKQSVGMDKALKRLDKAGSGK